MFEGIGAGRGEGGVYFGTLSGKGRWRCVLRAITVARSRRSIPVP
jgi:hypothetical protein